MKLLSRISFSALTNWNYCKCVYENCALSLTDLCLVGRQRQCLKNRRKGIRVYEEVVGGWWLRAVLLERMRRKKWHRNNSCVFVCIFVEDIVHRFCKLQEENEGVSRWFLSLLFPSSLTCFSSRSLNYLVCCASSPVCSVATWKRRSKRWRWE